ncbi:MAG: type II toxin-antitoxin system RelE/ParE family toxin [Candidatus Nanopelagicales bacterium]
MAPGGTGCPQVGWKPAAGRRPCLRSEHVLSLCVSPRSPPEIDVARIHGIHVFFRGLRVIVSFGDRATDDLFHGRSTARARRFPADIARGATIKLDMLEAAASLRDLRSPPGNRLEILRGDLWGHHSIRVNEQWRLVFRWIEGHSHEVRLIDYH